MKRSLLPSIRAVVPVVALAAWIPSAAHASVMVSGGPTFDHGTFAVGGIEEGWGVGLEFGVHRDAGGQGPGVHLCLNILGYTGDADGDPIATATLDARMRRVLGEGEGARVFYAYGIGIGAIGTLGKYAAAVPLTGELGVQIGSSDGGGFVALSVRERPILLMGEQADFVNNAQLQLTIGRSFGSR